MEKVISPVTGKSKYLLVENCEFVSNVKISNELKESLKLSTGKAGTLIVKNLPGTILNRENQNGRIYSTAVLAQAIREAKPLFEAKQLLSQACEHPEGSFVSPTTASHVVTNAYIKKNVNVVVDGERGNYDMLFMDIEVLNTDEGKNLRALLEAECSVGTSIRGVGDMEGKYVKNYEFLGIDFVGNPSSSTFTRMPVSESVKVEVRDPRDMKETFNVATSSTNVVRDLDQAAVLQQQLDGLGYGTVTKTSTKLDQETDPKTGAQTSIATLEAETSDDVADLDQALQMARNAMLNGTINVDSITIENIPEDDTKESVEYVPEKTTLKEKPVTEAKDDKGDPNLGKKFVLHTDRGFVTYDKNAIDFTNKPEDALHFTLGKEENGMVSMSKVIEILDAMGIFEVEKYFQKGDVNLGATVDEGTAGALIGGTAGAAMGALTGTPTGVTAGAVAGGLIGSQIQDGNFPPKTENTISEENGSNTKYTAQVTINDENGSNHESISVSAVDLDSAKNEISNLWEMKNKGLNGNGTVDIMLIDTTTGEQLHYNPETKLLECNAAKTEKDLKEEDEETTPTPNYKGYRSFIIVNDMTDSSRDFDNDLEHAIAITQEDADDLAAKHPNFDIKAYILGIKEDGKLDFDDDHVVEVIPDYGIEDAFEHGPEVEESSEDTVKVDDNKVITKLDNDTTLEKEFDSPLQAKVATAAVAQDKVDPSILLPEADVEEKLYNNPSEPSDGYVKEPLEDAVQDILVTLEDIDWDIEAILASLDDGEDVDEVIEALPDPWTIRLNAVDLDGANDIKAEILKAANEQAPWAINNATITNISDPDTNVSYYDADVENNEKDNPVDATLRELAIAQADGTNPMWDRINELFDEQERNPNISWIDYVSQVVALLKQNGYTDLADKIIWINK